MKMFLYKIIEVVLLLSFVVASFPPNVQALSQPNCAQFSVTHDSTTVFVSGAVGLLTDDDSYEIVYQVGNNADGAKSSGRISGQDQSFSASFSINYDALRDQNATVAVKEYPRRTTAYCANTIRLNSETGLVEIVDGAHADPFVLCKQAGEKLTTCQKCFEEDKIWTAVGCIPFTSQAGMVRALMTLGLSITGTIVVLMTLYAGFLFSTSQGDPKRVDEAKSAMTSAIVGAFFIIFSVTILNFIGVTVLHLPSFG